MNSLEGLRKQIDSVDEKIFILLSKRMGIVREIGKVKKENNLSVLDKKRWDKILNSTLSKADTLNLSKDFIKKFYNLIHKYSLQLQKER